jgi:hypothetical protein
MYGHNYSKYIVPDFEISKIPTFQSHYPVSRTEHEKCVRRIDDLSAVATETFSILDRLRFSTTTLSNDDMETPYNIDLSITNCFKDQNNKKVILDRWKNKEMVILHKLSSDETMAVHIINLFIKCYNNDDIFIDNTIDAINEILGKEKALIGSKLTYLILALTYNVGKLDDNGVLSNTCIISSLVIMYKKYGSYEQQSLNVYNAMLILQLRMFISSPKMANQTMIESITAELASIQKTKYIRIPHPTSHNFIDSMMIDMPDKDHENFYYWPSVISTMRNFTMKKFNYYWFSIAKHLGSIDGAMDKMNIDDTSTTKRMVAYGMNVLRDYVEEPNAMKRRSMVIHSCMTDNEVYTYMEAFDDVMLIDRHIEYLDMLDNDTEFVIIHKKNLYVQLRTLASKDDDLYPETKNIIISYTKKYESNK